MFRAILIVLILALLVVGLGCEDRRSLQIYEHQIKHIKSQSDSLLVLASQLKPCPPCLDTAYRMPPGRWVKVKDTGCHDWTWIDTDTDNWKSVTRSYYKFPWPDSLGKPDSVFIPEAP